MAGWLVIAAPESKSNTDLSSRPLKPIRKAEDSAYKAHNLEKTVDLFAFLIYE